MSVVAGVLVDRGNVVVEGTVDVIGVAEEGIDVVEVVLVDVDVGAGVGVVILTIYSVSLMLNMVW